MVWVRLQRMVLGAEEFGCWVFLEEDWVGEREGGKKEKKKGIMGLGWLKEKKGGKEKKERKKKKKKKKKEKKKKEKKKGLNGPWA